MTTSSARKTTPNCLDPPAFINALLLWGVLHMVLLLIPWMTIFAWLSRLLRRLCISFVELSSENLDQSIWEHQMNKTLLGSWHKTEQGDFLGCLEALTTCIGHGRIAHLFARRCTNDILVRASWFEAVAGYDMWIWHAFFWHVRISKWHQHVVVLSSVHETSECHASPGNYVINNHKYTKGYYLADDIYPQLWRQFMARMWRTKHGFSSARRVVGMELSEHLVCSRRVLLFFDTPLSNGQRLRYERSRMLVWSSTTWSLRVSALIQCMMIFHMIGRGLSPKLITWCQPVWKISSIEIRNQDVPQQL
jgi:hypothetical protein